MPIREQVIREGARFRPALIAAARLVYLDTKDNPCYDANEAFNLFPKPDERHAIAIKLGFHAYEAMAYANS